VFLPQGWLFMAFVIFIESLLLTKFLNHCWFSKRIYTVTTITNVISGIVGIIISMALNGGWWLVVWFPWVGNNEVDTNFEGLKWLSIFYISAFVLTIIIEMILNYLFLRKQYKRKKILISTLIANIISYFIGTIVLYSYSFS
jgi:hypothetical protein